MSPTPSQSGRVFKTGVQLAFLGVLFAGALNYQKLWDTYAVATYRPPAEVAAIESRLALSPAAQAYVARAQPIIDDKAAFNRDCQTTKGELELGCYYRGRIYILRIDNTSLAPEMDVVMAHEVLHAAWDRLSAGERQKIGTLLQASYAVTSDQDLRDRMAEYARTEPGEQNNELHSILGTEQSKLSPDLDAYYSRYFLDRSQVVAAHAKYQGVFDSRRGELENQLASIRTLKAQLATLNSQLTGLKQRGDISSYNALVPRQNRLVDNINNAISTYQSGVEEYNALSRSLDSQEITETETGVSQ